jgi:acetyl-CoA decarbonylase/synthase complex subunit gamma
MGYMVRPGLYAVGNPGPASPVLVSANFKLSFDHLRSNLSGRDAWIMVLDTKGINVWCAAGKGTFGTDEMVRRVEATRLAEIVSHRRLVVPQLGAPGVAAHEVKKRTKFAVKYGPVRAKDVPSYLDAGMKATPSMRRVRFSVGSRLLLVPVEVVVWARWAALIMAVFFLLSGLGSDFYSMDRLLTVGVPSLILLAAAYFAGVVLTPTLLPWLPGRSFASKGAWAGFLVAAAAGVYEWYYPGWLAGRLDAVAWVLIILVMSSFLGMNFTGSSTYTSLSGVKKEMRMAVPIQIAGGVLGMGLWLVGRFV